MQQQQPPPGETFLDYLTAGTLFWRLLTVLLRLSSGTAVFKLFYYDTFERVDEILPDKTYHGWGSNPGPLDHISKFKHDLGRPATHLKVLLQGSGESWI